MRRTRMTKAVARELIGEPVRAYWSYGLAESLTRKLDRNVYRGSVFRILLALRGAGWVEDFWDTDPVSGPPARHYFRATAEGKRAMARFLDPELFPSETSETSDDSDNDEADTSGEYMVPAAS